MASFSRTEIDYLTGERRFGRIATVDAAGQPHVVPVGWWRYNPELGTLDIAGHRLSASKKFRNVKANPKVAFVVDDMAFHRPIAPPRGDGPGTGRGRGGRGQYLRRERGRDHPHRPGEGRLLGPRRGKRVSRSLLAPTR
jgi:PPOX class F420-dependent enzyme/OxyR family protein